MGTQTTQRKKSLTELLRNEVKVELRYLDKEKSGADLSAVLAGDASPNAAMPAETQTFASQRAYAAPPLKRGLNRRPRNALGSANGPNASKKQNAQGSTQNRKHIVIPG